MSSKKVEVTVDPTKCLGYGICLSLPEVFDLPAGSSVAVTSARFYDESMLDVIQETAKSCPASAIHVTLRDESEAEQLLEAM